MKLRERGILAKSLWVGLWGSLLGVVVGCGFNEPPRLSLPETLRASNANGLLDGSWVSDGYGWALEIEGGSFRAYNYTTVFCTRDPELEENLATGGDASAVVGDQIVAGSAVDPSRYLFLRADGLPAACERDATTVPEGVVEAALAAFDEHYVFFEKRGVNWDSLKTDSRARVSPQTSDDELKAIFSGMFEAIQDPHVTLEGPNFRLGVGASESDRQIKEVAASRGVPTDELVTEFLRDHIRRDIRQEVFSGPSEARGGGRVNFGKITDDVGYISIVSFDQLVEGEMEATINEIDTALDDAIELWGNVHSVIVDVSANLGGMDQVGRLVAARFASEPSVGVLKFAGDAQDQTHQPLPLEPAPRTRFTGDVYVLTSDLTVSAGESFVMYMRALPNVTHVGQPTRGALSDMLYKPLPNGWLLSVSNEVYLDSEGEEWEARGVEPDRRVEVFEPGNPFRGHSEAVHRLVDAITRHTPS